MGWALALSAGVHLIILLTLDLSPGPWRHGLQPAFQVELRPAPGGLEEPRAVAPRKAGLRARQAVAGSTVPTPVRYFRNNEVDVPATPILRGPLVLPEHAYVSRLHGTVRARVYIGEAGAAESVQILEVRPVSGIFEEAALEALRQVLYSPALIAGTPVKTEKVIEVTFNPYEDESR